MDSGASSTVTEENFTNALKTNADKPNSPANGSFIGFGDVSFQSANCVQPARQPEMMGQALLQQQPYGNVFKPTNYPTFVPNAEPQPFRMSSFVFNPSQPH